MSSPVNNYYYRCIHTCFVNPKTLPNRIFEKQIKKAIVDKPLNIHRNGLCKTALLVHCPRIVQISQQPKSALTHRFTHASSF